MVLNLKEVDWMREGLRLGKGGSWEVELVVLTEVVDGFGVEYFGSMILS